MQETQTKPKSTHNHGFEQFQEIPNFFNISTDVSFKLQKKALKIDDTYFYLVIVLHGSSELKTTQSTIKTRALFELVNSLIKPTVLYGATVWTPESAINKSIIRYLNCRPHKVINFTAKIDRKPSEKVYLSFLKWALGVHKNTSNVGVWGETGIYPFVYQSSPLIQQANIKSAKKSIFCAALKKQKLLKLP